MCLLNTCFLLDGLFYISIFLVIAEELLQDYFVRFHFQTGIKVDCREFALGLESANFTPGQKAKTKDVIYFSTGENVFFRVRHIFYNPFFMPFHLKGEARKADQGWQVVIRMNYGILLFLFAGMARYVHPLAGPIGAVGGFFIIKRFGLPHMWKYWEQASANAAQQEVRSGLSNE
jgi:hypothetical protein